MIVVTAPRIAPSTLPTTEGLEVRAYVHDLDRHLAACDLAIIHGGLTTAMELTAHRRPFIYFRYAGTSSRIFHVDYRLKRYGAGRRMDYDSSSPDAIAEAIAQELGRTIDYRPVAADGAAQAAAGPSPSCSRNGPAQGRHRLCQRTSSTRKGNST